MIQWGTVGEWVGGVGAIIGAGVPLMLYLVERRERIAAQAEAKVLRANEVERARQQQARRISVSFTWRKADAWHGINYFAVLSNGSDLPVQRAALVSTSPKGDRIVARWGVVGAGTHEASLFWHATRTWPYRLVFVDDNGACWVRRSTGELEETDATAFEGIPELTLDDVDD
ncbi:hypothetical protein JN535_04760 [Cellulosimicrobium cellulans]|uniref:hypothetical protein n=1 Tax=Cellulosimicrobium cellulans TaxID=1710 RepID=UPI001965D863|nr:hypothetical protein [Cellulosimicrobium cellulans]MBN0039486.1 hypothetical protein [Cellulosimicrobium cellulans]